MRSRPIRPPVMPALVRAALAVALIGFAPGLALAQSVAPGQAADAAPTGVIRVDLAGQSAGSQNLAIPRGKSAIIDLPIDARDVLVTNPAVADVVLRSPRRIYILGVTAGQTDAAFFDAAGRRILGLNIRVDQDFSALGQTINRVIPGAQVRVEPINNSVVLTGQVASAEDSVKAAQIAAQFTAGPNQVVNMLSITGKEQVMLKVRIVEVQRSIVKQLGFDLSAVVGKLGSSQFVFQQAATYGVNGALLGGLSSGYKLDTTKGGTVAGSNGVNQAESEIQAFEQVGLIRTLAEPTLTAISGESARFLAGGEYPVPTGEDTTGRVSITFKPYGVGLGFTPVVLSGGRISLKISTEVSELTSVGSISISAGSTSSSTSNSITVPGLNVRRAETTVELPSGGAMMIAGLLKEEAKEDISSLPGLTNLPVLGALFRSRDYQDGETELVVIVTPYLVNPTSPSNLQTPADGLEIANDAETVLLGRLNKVYKAPPAAVAGRTYQGPVGYVIE
ncbi:MAG: type II and III secretion system protein family protein [Caulobacteraceae bacterium]|nr:type II and III secretion system protein family protein [Caulobacteraceae bacterium]